MLFCRRRRTPLETTTCAHDTVPIIIYVRPCVYYMCTTRQERVEGNLVCFFFAPHKIEYLRLSRPVAMVVARSRGGNLPATSILITLFMPADRTAGKGQLSLVRPLRGV